MEASHWRALLDGDAAAAALRAVHAIADGLAAREISSADLVDGRAGVALLFAYLAGTREHDDEETAYRLIEDAFDAVAASTGDLALPMLDRGFVGIAWVVEHLQRRFGAADDDINASIDEVLEGLLERTEAGAPIELLRGLIGLGVYARARSHRESGRALTARIGTLVDAAGTWSPNEAGIAHGTAGAVAWLAEVGSPRVDDCVRLLVEQEAPQGLGWCRGEVGIAAALLRAARFAKQPAWEERAIEIARQAAGDAPLRSHLDAPGLCHGAASYAHLFNRMYQATGDAVLGEAARRWFTALLEVRHDQRPGLLTGAAGIALTLLSAATDIEPAWDEVLLVSIPPESVRG